MSILRSKLSALRRENQNGMDELEGITMMQVRKMMRILESSAVSLFELEVIKKDVIALAREADIEKVSLEDKLGIPLKEFCDNLLRDVVICHPKEQLLVNLKSTSMVLASTYGAQFIITNSAPRDYGMPMTIAIVLLFCIVFNISLWKFNWYRAVYEKGWSSKLKCLAPVITLIVTFVVVERMYEYELMDFNVFKISGWIILGILIAVTVVLAAILNHHWDNCAKKFNWL